ncbi:MAG: hypothetical protein WA941_07755 [Nitrososphaeraceae archaeon]
MSKHSRTKLVPPKMEPENQVLETIEESIVLEQKEEPTLRELDMEIQCPKCNEIMQLRSIFDKLAYSCEYCHFSLECV